MKKNLTFLIGLLCFQLNGQSLLDAHRYSLSTTQGSARFAAMGGAFGAVGGDFSAIEVNPASSAIFGFSEVGFSVNALQLNNTAQYFNATEEDKNNDLSIGQGGVVLILNENTGSDWSKLSFAFTINQTGNFDQSYRITGINPHRGIDQYFLFHASGQRRGDISQLDGETFNQAYIGVGENSGYPGQQALFGYEAFVINPIPFAGTTNSNDPDIRSYSSNTQAGPNGYTHEYNTITSGQSNKYNINLSTVYQDKLYLGVNINLFNIEYAETINFYEYGYGPQSGLSELNFNNELITLGTGNSFQIGAIYKVNSSLRLGLSFESPTYYRLSDQVRQSLHTTVNTPDGEIAIDLNPLGEGIETVFPSYRFNAPGNIRASLAYIIKDIGLFSFDYSIKSNDRAKFLPKDDAFFIDLNNQIEASFQANHRMQIGGEIRLNPQISLRAGYSTESASMVAFDNSQTIMSGGFGYNFGASNLDVALQLQDLAAQQALFPNGLTDTVNLNQDNLNLIFTYRLKL